MMKETKLAWLALGIAAIIIILGIVIVIKIVITFPANLDEKLQQQCIKDGYECPHTLRKEAYKGCSDDCKKIGLVYYKYEHSVFASDECWCLNQKQTIQVW